jgi:PKD repeat protein
LSSRKNGHTVACDTLGSNTFRYNISESTSASFFGSSGILLTIPVTLTEDWESGTSQPVLFNNTEVKSGTNVLDCPAKNGAIRVQADTSSVFASFFPDIFLNRVYFHNLSSESADAYRWDFGDGTSSSERNPLHHFAQAGKYTVQLKVTLGAKADSIQQTLDIADQSSWKVSGTFTLDKNKSGVKNFTDVVEMFNVFSQASVTGDLRIQVTAGQTFVFDVNDASSTILESLLNKMQSVNHRLLFSADGQGTAPVINFAGTLTQVHMENVLRIWKKMQTTGVTVQLLDDPLDINVLNIMTSQLVCSESVTDSVDLKRISTAISFRWEYDSVATDNKGSFLLNGNELIPPMTLINDSTIANKLVYAVFSQGKSNFRLMTYTFTIQPKLKGIITLTQPKNNQLMESISVNFGWTPVPNAVYDLYIWEKQTQVPPQALLSGITGSTYTNASFCKYGKAYYWKVMARGSCNSIESPVDSFVVRTLPDLQVTQISYPQEMYAADAITVRVKITNKGDRAPATWIRDELLMARNAGLEGLISLTAQSNWRSVEKDSSYFIDFKINIPADTIQYTCFVAKTDIQNYLLESNELNNMLISDSMHIVQPLIDDHDYAVLRDVYLLTKGSYWNTKWKTGSNVLIAANWPGVTFNRGFVAGISLRGNKLTGQLPKSLFTLTKIKTLDLYDNQLIANLTEYADSLQAMEMQADSLTQLNLGKNNLTGEISVFADHFPMLTNLNLSYGKLSIVKALSPLITSLNLEYQAIQVDSITLSVAPILTLPMISRYNHGTQQFDFNPGFTLISGNNGIAHMYYSNSSYRLNWWNNEGWMIHSGAQITLRQDQGPAAWSTAPFKLFFSMGDANVDQQINILDVQHTLNHILRDNPKPYNFRAADTYTDNSMTVQDIVSTVNIILVAEGDTTPVGMPARAPGIEVPRSTLSIEKGSLMLDALEAVSAMDITLKNVNANQIRMMLSNVDFQIISMNVPNGSRFIIFSPTGNSLPAGNQVIAELYGNAPGLVRAALSDRMANAVPCRITQSVTGLNDAELSGIRAYFAASDLKITIPAYAEKLSVQLYNMQGMLVRYDEREFVPAGIQVIPYAETPADGMYLLHVQLKNGDSYEHKTIKLLISK